MDGYNKITDVLLLVELPKSRDKLLKILQSIEESLADSEVVKLISSQSKLDVCNNCSWNSLCQFIVNLVNWFIKIVDKDRVSKEWSLMPLNKKIIELAPTLLKIVLSNAIRENCVLKENGIFILIGEILTNYSSSMFNVCIGFLKIITSEIASSSPEHFVSITQSTWEEIEKSIHRSLCQIVDFDEQHVLLLMALLSVFKLMIEARLPDLEDAADSLMHVTNLSGLNSSIKACGFVAAIYKHLVEVHGLSSLTRLADLGVSLSRNGLIKTWLQYQHHGLTTDETSSSVLTIAPRVAILHMWRYVYLQLYKLDCATTVPKYTSWARSVTVALCDEMEFLEKRLRCSVDEHIFEFTMTLLTQEKFVLADVGNVRFNKTRLTTEILAALSSDNGTTHLFWFSMLRAGLDNKEFVILCRPDFHRIVDALNAVLSRSNCGKEVVVACLNVAGRLAQLVDQGSWDFSSLTLTVVEHYLSSPYCEYACGYLRSVVIKERASLSPSDFLPSLLSQPITNHTLNLASTVVSHIPSSVSVRKLLSIESCCDLLTVLTNVSRESKISFANCCTCISTLIVRKSSRANCYRSVRPIEGLKLYEDIPLTLEGMLEILDLNHSYLKDDAECKPDIRMLNFSTLSKPERTLLHFFLNASSQSTSLPILLLNLSMLSEIFQHEDIAAYRHIYLSTTQQIQNHLENSLVASEDLEGICYISWHSFSLLSNQTEDSPLRDATTRIFSTFDKCILQKLSDLFNNTQHYVADLFTECLHCYLSFLSREDSLVNVKNTLELMCNDITLSKLHNILALHYIVRGILRFKVRMSEEFYSKLLAKLRQGFKVYKDNSEICKALINVVTDIVILVLEELVDRDARRKIVDFFYDLSVVVRRIMETKFPRKDQLGLALARQRGVMFCYYWKENVESARLRCREICDSFFSVALKKSSLVGKFFVSSIADNLPDSQLSTAVLELISCFPREVFTNILSNEMEIDVRRCTAAFFLQMWLFCPISLVGSNLLQFIDKAFPNDSLKCEFLSKVIAFFHRKGADANEMLSRFLYTLLKIQLDCGTKIPLPDGVDIRDVVEMNAAEILWAVFTNDDEDKGCVIKDMLTFTRYANLDQMIADKGPQLMARSIARNYGENKEDVTFSPLASNVVKYRLPEVYINILEYASSYDDCSSTRFRELTSLLNNKYLDSQSAFDDWLLDKPCHLMDLVMTFVSKCDGRDWKTHCRSWNTMLEVLITSHKYWHTVGTHVDTGVSFLILRHLNSMKYSILHDDARIGMVLLGRLVTLAHNVVRNFNCDLHVLWHQQIFHFFSLFWYEARSHKDVLVSILNPLTEDTRWAHSLNVLDQYILSTSGFCDLQPISQIIKQPHLPQSLTDFLHFFERYNVTFFRYHGKFFEQLSLVITSLGSSVSVDVALCCLLHQFRQIAHNFLTLCIDDRLYLKDGETNSSVMSIIFCLKVISSKFSYLEERSFLRNTPSVPVLGQFFSYLFYDLGCKAWSSYQFLRSIKINEDNSFLTDFFHFFKREGKDVAKLPEATEFQDEVLWDRMFTRILCVDFHHMLATDIFNASTLVETVLPYLGDTSMVEDKEVAIVTANTVIKNSLCNPDKRCKVMIQFVLSQFGSPVGDFISKKFDLMAAAKVASKVGMYTASLLFLERIWIQSVDKGISTEVIDLYKKCYKSLGCTEEFSGESFLLSEEAAPDSYMWLLKNGKFDILKQLLTQEPRKDDSSDHIKRMGILWRLSRWDDVEKYEVNHVNDDDVGNLLMYDMVYSKSEHIVNEYKKYAAVLCTTKWDEEECLEPLVKLATISLAEDFYEGSLVSLLNISNKSNISQLESSITWNLVSMGRCSNGKEAIARISGDICDMAVRCSRFDYIDLILDIVTSYAKDDGPLKCTGEEACFRMVAGRKYWNCGDKTRCSLKLEELISDCKNHLSSCQSVEHGLLKQLYCEAVSKICLWNRTHPMHSANHIRHNFLDPAIELISDDKVVDPRLLDAVSTFLYQQYLNIKEYMHSYEYDNRRKILTESRRDIGYLGEIDCEVRLRRTLLRQSTSEEGDLNSLLKDRETYLISAVNSCIQCLQWSDMHDHKIFGLISMWLDNCNNDTINNLMANVTEKIPTYKFLVLLPQLCARLNSCENTAFQKTLEKLIEEIATDHPYHSLYNIFALRNAAGETEAVSCKIKKKPRIDNMDGRMNSATNIIDRLLKGPRQKIIRDVELLTETYIKLAQIQVNEAAVKLKTNIPLPTKSNLLTVGVSVDLPNPLLHLTIDKSCKYPSNKLIKIIGFGRTYALIGGLNLPKVITCSGSDGVQRRQLVKCKDDLRQDSVMQQVFSVVNHLMHSTHPSEHRDLAIRTYKVIPTSKLTGVIEWCEGTVPLGDWLAADNTGAHVRYRPQDLSPSKCKSNLFKVKDLPLQKRMKVFKDIYEQIRPVLGYFLLENFPDPRQWFKARKAYTHSLAINSLVGYILGLGDRHVQNILIDLKTAELIHIDLGIAFDQGHLLPTPEVVPFRLTRDMVHALGPFGVEGRFRSTCCNVLSMLRSQKDVILTLIEVLMHDPLDAWSLSPQGAHSLQALRKAGGDGTENSHSVAQGRSVIEWERSARPNDSPNKMAERVILELSRKLGGNVENCSLSVEGHVNYLVQSAMELDNLARMFCGWQAYL